MQSRLVIDFGNPRHQSLLEQVVAHYQGDERVRAVAVFGSVATGSWHELSDIDLDVVTADDAAIAPAEEVRAIFGDRAQLVLASADSADIVLDSLEELSIRWHPLATTSPNIASSVRVVSGELSDPDLRVAAEANRKQPDEQRLLDQLVRDAVGASKTIRRGDTWSAASYVDRMLGTLESLLGRRLALELDPGDPQGALTIVLSEARASYELGPIRERVLGRLRRDDARAPRGDPPGAH
jgi:predicted nucleotidyltransferase